MSLTALTHPLIGATLNTFYRACTIHSVSDKLCSIIPLRDNPDFPLGLSGAFMKTDAGQTFFPQGQFYAANRTWVPFHFGLICNLNTSLMPHPIERVSLSPLRHWNVSLWRFLFIQVMI